MLRVIVSLSRKYGSVFQLWLGPLDTIVTSVPADIVQILSSTQLFDRPRAMQIMFEAVVPGSLMCAPRQLHLAMRKHFRDAFNYSSLQSFHPEMNNAVQELCQSLFALVEATPPTKPSQVFNIAELFAVTVFRVITNVAFGFQLSREQRLYLAKCTDQLVDEMMLDFAGYPLRHKLALFGTRNRLYASCDRVVQFCRPLIQERLEEEKSSSLMSRSPDLLDAIMSLEKGNLDAITNQAIVFAVAGAHTTTETLAWSIYETCRNPHVAGHIHDEIDSVLANRSDSEPITYEDITKLSYLKQVWMETLRKHPPGPMFARTAQTEVSLAGSGIRLPKGTTVVALAHGAHMNPTIWDNPEGFIPERWAKENGHGMRSPPGAYIPFSVGAKSCPGRFLADHEGLLILAEIHRRFVFNLACNPHGLVSCSGWAEFARACGSDVDANAGLPVTVGLKL